jgi:methyl-accepting chemotaxis protein
MKAGVVTPEQQSLLNDLIPIAEFQSRNMTDGLEKVYAYNAGLKSKVNSGRAMDDTRAFFALARQSVINKQDFAPDTQARYLELANKGIGEQYQLSTRLLDELDALIAARVATMVGERIVVTVVLVMGLLLAAYFFYCFILVNGGSLRMISTHLREMAEGDLRKAPSKPFGRDESSLVVEDMRVTYVALHGLIRKVRHSARALHAAANEIAHASTELAARTENAASTLEEQASAMEEIGSTVGGTAERAQMASTFANDNAHVAEKGGHVFGEVTATMREIHTSSSRINDIIGTIDGIAFQTNILALNAAVEAARAGESGRGFAVVASEVRSLAGRSADAAREIKSLISQSVEKVEGGTRVVESAGGTMKEVVTNARQINQFLTEIAAAAREQSVGVSEVGRSIQELDKTTQQNAALVEETTSAAAALREQADLLQEEIANFRVA